MKAKRLLLILSEIDDELVEEAAQPVRRRRVWGKWAALAACVALLIGAAVAWPHLRPAQMAQDNAYTLESGAPLNDTESATSDSAEMEMDQAMPGEEETPMDGTGGDLTNANSDEEGVQQEDEPTEEADDAQFGDAAQQMTLGGLWRGMTEAEVRALLGEPKETSNSGPVEIGGYRFISWWYDLEEPETDYRSDLQLGFIDMGDGWVLNEIMTFGNCPLRLETGIGVGSTEEAVRAAYPDAVRQEDGGSVSYQITGADGDLVLSMEDGVVRNIWLQPRIDIELPDETAQTQPAQGPPAYIPCADTMTISHGAEARTVSGQAAKRIETILNIEQLAPQSAAGETVYQIDLQNGWTIGLLADGSECGWVETDAGIRYAVRFPAGTEAAVAEAWQAAD